MRTLLLLFALLYGTAAHADERVWTGAGDGVSFGDARNWTDEVVPGPSDHAIIGGAANVSVGTRTVARLTLADTARLRVGGFDTFAVGAGGAVVGPQAAFVFDGPNPTLRIDGGGTFRVEGRVEWVGWGAIRTQTSGQVAVAPGGVLDLPGTGTRVLWVPITNEGTIRLGGSGTVTVNATITNGTAAAPGVVEIAADAALSVASNGGTGRIEGPGRIVKRGAGTATVSVTGDVSVGAGGDVEVEAGALVLTSRTVWTDAAVAVADGARLELAGSAWHTVGGTLAGAPAGTFLLRDGGPTAGLVAADGGGTLALGGTGLQVRNASLGGQLAGGMPVGAPVNAGLLRVVEVAAYVNGTLRSPGTLRWEGGDLRFGRVPGAPARLLAEGLFEIASAGNVQTGRDNVAVPTEIVVSGVLRKAGAGTATLSEPVRIAGGTADAQGGTLRLLGESSWASARVVVAEGARIALDGNGTHEVSGLLTGEPVGAFTLGLTPGLLPQLVAGPTGGALLLGGTGLTLTNGYLGTAQPSDRAVPVNRGFVRVQAGETRVAGRFRSEGTIRWEAGTLRLWRADGVLDVAGRLEVAPTAALNLTYQTGAEAAALEVSGVLVKTGALLATLDARTRLSGRVDVREGELRFTSNGRGEWVGTEVAVAPGASLVLASNGIAHPQTVSGRLHGRIDGLFQVGRAGASIVALLGQPNTGAMLDLGGTGLTFVWGEIGSSATTGPFADFPAPRNAGLLRLAGAAFSQGVNLARDFQNDGTIRWESGQFSMSGTGVRTLTNTGRIEALVPGNAFLTLSTSVFQTAYTSRLVNRGTIVFGGGEGRTDVSATTFNEGVIEAAPGRTVRFVRLGSTGNALNVSAAGALAGGGTFDATQLVLVQNGALSPGADGGAATGTLRWTAPAPPGRLLLDVRSPTDRDVLEVVGPAAAPGTPLPLGAATLVVRPGPDVQIGQTFDVVAGATTGLPARVLSLRPDLGFAASATPLGLRLTATAPPADAPIAALPDRVVGGGTREVLLTGQTFAAASTVRLECTDCLEPAALGTIPGAVVATDGATLTARFDLLDPRAFGRYDVVVSADDRPDRRGPVTLVPPVSLPIVAYTGTDRIPIVPETSQGGYRFGQVRVFNVSNAPEPTVHVLRFRPPAPAAVRVRLARFGRAEAPGESALWTRASADDEGLLLVSLRSGEAFPLALGTGVSPEHIDFSTAPALTVGPEAPAAAVARDPATGCSLPQPLGPRHLARSADPDLIPFGALLDVETEVLRGAPDLLVGDAAAESIEDGFCPRFFDELEATFGAGAETALREAIAQAMAALREAGGAMPVDPVAPPSPLSSDGTPHSFVEFVAAALAGLSGGAVPASTWENAARQCSGGGGSGFGRALEASIRTRIKGNLDALRRASQSGNTLLDDLQNSIVEEMRALGQAIAGAFGFSPEDFDAALQVESETIDGTPACSPVPRVVGVDRQPTGFVPRLVGGSWDPNDKTGDTRLPCEPGVVVVDGEETVRCVRHYIPLAEAAAPVPFTIHFENLPAAIAAAERVEITDVLDPALDPATLRVTGSSADSLLAVSVAGQTVTFLFDGIDLPPNVNPPEGQGFVSFEVHPRAPLPDGQVVRNHASIVFDFNPPIVTPDVEYAVRQVADPTVAVAYPGLPDGGRPYTTTWTIGNGGPDPAPESTLSFSLLGATATAVSASRGTCSLAPLRCTFGEMVAGETATVTMTLVPAAFGGLMEIVGTAGTSVVDGFRFNSRALIRATVGVVDDEDEPVTVTGYALERPFPNPVRHGVTLGFSLGAPGLVRVGLYDASGREVRRLVDGELTAGRHTVAFHADGLAAGVYLVRMLAGDFGAAQRLTVVR